MSEPELKVDIKLPFEEYEKQVKELSYEDFMEHVSAFLKLVSSSGK